MRSSTKIFNLGWIIVVLVTAFIGLFFLEGTSFSKQFWSITGEPLNEKSVDFFVLFSSLLGAYIFFLVNLVGRFRDKLSLIIWGTFSITLLGVCLWLISWILNLQVDIEFEFKTLSFPTDPEFVAKELKISMLDKVLVSLIGLMGSSLLFLIVSMLKFIQRKVISVDNR